VFFHIFGEEQSEEWEVNRSQMADWRNQKSDDRKKKI